jgi:hypothetical protein
MELDSLKNVSWEPARFPPFPWNTARRAVLRAELRYVLDTASVMGVDYPSNTFRVLKNGKIRDFGEYRSERLGLEAWDREERR